MGIFDMMLYSPNYPNGYYNNQDCSWSFLLESGRALVATFTDMDIEESEGCAKDSIVMVWTLLYSRVFTV